MQPFELIIRETHSVSPRIRELLLEATPGSTLASYSPGSHLRIHLPNSNEYRCYSLLALESDHNWNQPPTHYRLGVRLEENSQGGSKYMHQLQKGDTVKVTGPFNDFPLLAAQADETELVLIAGGIGITPIASMALQLKQQQRAFTLHYSARTQEQLAFATELNALLGQQLVCYSDDSTSLELTTLLDQLSPKQPLYICGPQGMIDALIALSKERGWAPEDVHFELFVTAAPQDGDQAFELELRQSGLTFTVPADKTILQVLEEAGEDLMYDCLRGECGVCTADVLEGVPDHRDYFLTDKEKESGKVIQICISRSKSPKLVLDL